MARLICSIVGHCWKRSRCYDAWYCTRCDAWTRDLRHWV